MTVLVNRLRFTLSRIWRGKGFVRNVAVLAGGTALGQAVTVLASPILTRLYTPAALGTWAILMSFALVPAAVASWRYEYAIMLPERDEDAAHVLTLSSFIVVLMSGLALIATGLFRHQLAQLLGIAEFAQWLWLLPLILLLRGLYQAGNYWFARKKQFVRLAVAGVSRSMVSVGSQIGAALLTGASPVGLLIGTVVGESIATSILSTDIRERFRHLLPNSHFWTTVWDNIYRFRNFPLYTAPYSFAGVCAKRLLFLLLGVYATTNEVGLYAIAVKLTRLPASLVSSAIKPVIFQMAARELGSGRVERLVVRLLMLETIFGAPVLVFFLFNARWVFGIVFGDAWAAAGTYAMWLALPAFTRLLASWPDRVFDITGRQRLALLMEVLYDILSLALFGLSLAWLNSVKWAVGLHSSVTALYYLILVVVAFRVAKFSLRGLWRIAAIFLGIVSVAGAVHWAVLILFPKIAAVTIYVALMGAYYAYLVFRFRKRRASPFRGRY